MSGKAILVVGARGTGKTYGNRKMIEKTHPQARLILDVNGEYKDLFPNDPIEFDAFTKVAKTVKKAVILIEECTIYLSNRGNNSDIRDLLVKARHNDNTIIMVFHSFRSIPKYVYDLCNMVIIYKTADNAELISTAFEDEKLTAAFNEIKAAPWLKNDQGKTYSPHKIYSIY